MINSLACAVTFASSGFTLDSKFQPLTGITAVVGENGVGKTFSTIELTRYLLYGKKALRGPAGGYKNLEASGDFTIRGEQYHIERTPKGESISNEAGTVLAVNATAVTEKVTELMGYGLEVFDVCNASTQGNTHLFSQKQPAERKRMIDQVVGLASNEVIEKACRTEAATLRREAEAMAKGLITPVPPTATFPGRLSPDIEQELEEGRELRKKYEKLIAKRVFVFAEPTKPDMPVPNPADIRLLQNHQDEERSRLREREALEAISPPTGKIYGEAYLDSAKARLAKRNELARLGPKPILTQAEVEHEWQVWSLYDTHVVSNEVTCPNCNHMFRPTGDSPLEGGYNKQFLRDEAKRIAKWDGVDDTLPDGEDMTEAEIEQGYKARIDEKAYKSAIQRLSTFPVPDDRQQQLDALRALQAQWQAYLAIYASYLENAALNSKVDAEIAALPEIPKDSHLDKLAEDLAAARLFETQWAAWDKQVIAFNQLSEQIADKNLLAEEFKKGGAALADARATIKAFLAPALARTASSLLYDMTNGKLSNVSIDDDMNILVGSQTLETLSGGGLTAANIALRIALGQVLVSDTFPVFLGDEIDADVDSVRREAIIEAMVGLKQHLSQIILVTHRDVSVADHIFEVGND